MIKLQILLLPLFLCLSGTAFAQVYKSTDSEGNVTFSDTPSADSEAVKVEETNVADPTEVPEYTPPPPKPTVVQTERPPEARVEKEYDDDGGYRGIRPRAVHRRRIGHHHRR